MLRGISPLLTPPILAGIAEMGHWDLLAIVDRNFPAYGRGRRVAEAACDVAGFLDALLPLFPVDVFDRPALIHMRTDAAEDGPALAGVLHRVRAACDGELTVEGVARHDFYPLAETAYLTIRTTDTLPYACFLLRKGVV